VVALAACGAASQVIDGVFGENLCRRTQNAKQVLGDHSITESSGLYLLRKRTCHRDELAVFTLRR
jgi:hypothetical protein